MPEGQFLGSRKAYVYTADDATSEYYILLDETLASLAGVSLPAYTGQTGVQPLPKRFKPRIVYWESNDGVYRKRITCGSGAATLYAANTSQTLTIDGVDGRTTGRVGEKFSFVKLQVSET